MWRVCCSSGFDEIFLIEFLKKILFGKMYSVTIAIFDMKGTQT
jgi:hypothetical protein